MWHVSSRSGVATLRTAGHLLLTYLLLWGWGGHAHAGFEAVNVVDKVSIICEVTACRDNLTCLLQLQFAESALVCGNSTRKVSSLKLRHNDICTSSRVVSVLDSGAEGPGFKSQSRRYPVTVLGKLFTPTVPLFTIQRNWWQPC